MIVILSSCGDPDFGQKPKKEQSPRDAIKVFSISQASKVCVEYIDKYDLGGGNWTGGQILSNGKQIAAVSYNGRVWDRHGKEIR